jgi:hypothetical protein
MLTRLPSAGATESFSYKGQMRHKAHRVGSATPINADASQFDKTRTLQLSIGPSLGFGL